MHKKMHISSSQAKLGFKLSILAFCAVAIITTMPMMGVERALAQDESQLDVMFQHRVYQPLNIGVSQILTLQVPVESVSWWQGIERLTFMNGNDSAVAIDSFEIVEHGSPNATSASIRLTVNGQTEGTFRESRLNAVEEDGTAWAVPFGVFEFEIYQSSHIAERGQIFSCDLLGQSGSYASLGADEFRVENVVTDGITHDERFYVARVQEVQWGESLFSTLESTEFELRHHLNLPEGTTVTTPVELPFGLIAQPDGPHTLQFQLSLSNTSLHERSIVNFDPLLAFKFSTQQVELYYEAVDCDNIPTPVVDETESGIDTQWIERLQPQLLRN